MPQTTIAAACRERGIDRKVWDEARRQGVDPWDRKAMDEWLGSRRHRMKQGAKVKGKEAAAAQTLEEMEDAIRRSRSIDDVKILKEKVAALKIATQVRQETGELIPVGKAQQSMTRVVSAARGELLKLSADLAPRVEGLPAAQIQGVIRNAIIEVLTRLSDESSALYAG